MAILQINYFSKLLFRTVPLNVLLPMDKYDWADSDYSVTAEHRFKTLYLLHGLGGNYTDWIGGTRIQHWADEKNLAVVMPSADNSFYVNSPVTKLKYGDFIGMELVEMTRRMLPLSRKREDTFIAGLSMGGYGAIINGLNHSETFSRVAGLSSAVHLFDKTVDHIGLEYDVLGDVDEAALTNANPTVAAEELIKSKRPRPEFYMACGTKDGLYKSNTDLRDFLLKKGFEVSWDEDGSDHEWPFWDKQIRKVLDWLPLYKP